MMPHARATFQPYRAARRTSPLPKGLKSANSPHGEPEVPLFVDPHTGELSFELSEGSTRVDLEALFLRLSPRDTIRVDRCNSQGVWLHEYDRDIPVPEVAPSGPYAVHLADESGHFRWMLFDFDSKKGPTGPNLATLLRWLQEAGLTYVVAASGSDGGRHVWVACTTGLDPVLVKSIAMAARRRLPTTLDWGLLANPATGAARPIGAPHRNGSRSTLLEPEDPRDAAALLTPATCRNDSEAFTRLLLVIESVPAPSDVRIRQAGSPLVEVLTDGDEGHRLPGTPTTLLDDVTYRLLTRRPPGDQVSEVLASLLVRLALRRWNWLMVRSLLDTKKYREGGLLHATTSPGGGDLRVVLSDEKALAKLQRQWEKCVAFASTLPFTVESAEWSVKIAHVLEVVEQIQAAADAWPERWATEAGPADRAALDVRCLLALRSGSLKLALDVRRAALATGFGRSTMNRAQARLALDCWLAEDSEDEGPASSYELLPIFPQDLAAEGLESSVVGGGTQTTPSPTKGRRDYLMRVLETRLSAGRADLFSHGRPSLNHGGGLGHHAARTYQQLVQNSERALSLAEICKLTGYTERTAARHLTRMRNLGITTRAVRVVHHECPACDAQPGERCRTATGRPLPGRGTDQHAVRQTLAAERAGTPFHRLRPGGSLVAAAKALDVYGRTATRALWYTVEIAAWHWWQKEEERMNAEKAGVRTGVQVHREQAELVITTLPRQPHRVYPRADDGRADHHAARTCILGRLATR
ncbi:hypothetical protein ABZ726_05340 [Streptomyces hundungensis]|uniref:zinc finger domain-containing protein n=1 Tax=Streptomyces hundungensis TaxID=1077946 RepID=UPI0033F901C2